MSNISDITSLETLHLLEGRLDRIQFMVTGVANRDGNNHENDDTIPITWDQSTVIETLSQMERFVQQLVSGSKVIERLLMLDSAYSHLFPPQSSLYLPSQADSPPTDLDTASVVSIIKASASLYSETSSRLMSVTDLPIPSTHLSALLISLQPQVAKLGVVQSHQYDEILRLREKSAALMERWYYMNILPVGEAWAKLETRVRQVEQKIRRAAAIKKQTERISQDGV